MPLPDQSTILKANLEVPPLPGGKNCLKSVDDLAAWMKTIVVRVGFGWLFGYSSGTPAGAATELRSMPRFLYDDSDRYIGLAVWVPALGGWTIPGVIGELKTVQRTANVLTDDLKNKNLLGWHVCDGSTTGVPDLTAKMTTGDQKLIDPDNTLNSKIRFNASLNSPWFQGSGPEWDVYTVMYTGAP